jgi:two-component system, sensor histidine kinase YesM
MTLLTLYTVNRSYAFSAQAQEIHRQLMQLNDVSVLIEGMRQSVQNHAFSFRGTPSNYVAHYHRQHDEIRRSLADLDRVFDAGERHAVGDIESMVDTFHELATALFAAKSEGEAFIYLEGSVLVLNRHSEYVRDEVTRLLLEKLHQAEERYQLFSTRIRQNQRIVYLGIALVVILCTGFAFYFSQEISRPVHILARKMINVAEGRYEQEPISIRTNDEISGLIDSFNDMSVRLRQSIESMREKAAVEMELKRQQVEFFRMESLLKQSELERLQSEINPHFLFNTMTTISGLADVEGAAKTRRMIDSMSEILRASLRRSGKRIALRDEVRLVKEYLYIQSIRFGDKISYDVVVDDHLLDNLVPSMILQPFVENSIVHGLEPKIGPGRIAVNISRETELISILISDDGVGMDTETLARVTSLEGWNEDSKESIGIRNVLRRLEIEFGKRLLSITSAPNAGTHVRIAVPLLNAVNDTDSVKNL